MSKIKKYIKKKASSIKLSFMLFLLALINFLSYYGAYSLAISLKKAGPKEETALNAISLSILFYIGLVFSMILIICMFFIIFDGWKALANDLFD